ERRDAGLSLWIVRGQVHEHTDPPDVRGLLCPCGRWPRCRTSEERDELAALHWTTSSARTSTAAGISRPSAFAVLRLMTSSNFVGVSTGRSPGFVPLRILST